MPEGKKSGEERGFGECIPPIPLNPHLLSTHLFSHISTHTRIWMGFVISPQYPRMLNANTWLHVWRFFCSFLQCACALSLCLLVYVCLCCWMQISESPKQNAFQIPSPLRSALPLPECSAARQAGMEYGQCVVVGDWLCYWPTIYSLTSCFPLCLSSQPLKERFACLSLRCVVYVNVTAYPSVHLCSSLVFSCCLYPWAFFLPDLFPCIC